MEGRGRRKKVKSGPSSHQKKCVLTLWYMHDGDGDPRNDVPNEVVDLVSPHPPNDGDLHQQEV